MLGKKIIQIILIASLSYFLLVVTLAEAQTSFHTMCTPHATSYSSFSLSESAVAKQLGWVQTNDNRCGGYYLEPPFVYSNELFKNNSFIISSDQYVYSQHGTCSWKGRVTVTRYGQQVIANKAFLYRDPTTGEKHSIQLIDNVTLREPGSLVIAKEGTYNIKTKAEYLKDILYRTAIYSSPSNKPSLPTNEALQEERKVTQLSAWGQASQFSQEQPKIYQFCQASFSTCPPTAIAWQVKASNLVLNKNTGRGVARNARVLVGGVPVFYAPYLNFPLDRRRQTGFLPPTVGSLSLYGPYIATPFYWNIAPNYDSTFTPTFMKKGGILFSDLFRYLTPASEGNLRAAIFPHDRAFTEFRSSMVDEFGSSPSPVTQSNLNTLKKESTTRKSFSWNDKTFFNEHWSSNVDYSWVSDDYYLRDLPNNINQITQNQILQQGELNYKGINWDFTGRLQGYQTLHPVDQQVVFKNQYTRLPQLILAGDYPNTPGGFDYFINNEVTHFDIRTNPGDPTKLPIGNRLNTQPGISRPYNLPYLFMLPRIQLALTRYEIGDVSNTNPKNPSRVLPIFDFKTKLFFDREISFCNCQLKQTLEPEIYYVYVPYRNQNDLPVFDTTRNTLTYDQLFIYNRFSGIDRIGDANQVSIGLTTRFIECQSAVEKIRAGIGEIFYFQPRRVTLCSPGDPFCTPVNPNDINNREDRSPLSGILEYHLNQDWNATANAIWNVQNSHLDNQSIALHYQPVGNTQKILNLGYNFVRDGDKLPNDSSNGSANNLSQTDFSFSWPILRDWSTVGRWTQNWNHHHFQNLLYGLQYDSCCWAVRVIAGRVFSKLSSDNTFEYNTQFYIQLALKGLGNIGNADPAQVLGTSVTGYQSNFGRDF